MLVVLVLRPIGDPIPDGELLRALRHPLDASPQRPHPVAVDALGALQQLRGIDEMRRSLSLLGPSRLDLMQIHNLLDWRTHLETLRQWKGEGTIRYVGITHYTASAHAELAAVMRAEPLDFVQLNYSLEEPEAARELLPLAADRGVAVIVNRPFGGGALVRRLHGRALPEWAAELGCRTWSQLLLKYVLAHPAVTCVIPGTGNPQHMAEDCAAGSGPSIDPLRLEGLRP